MKVAIFSTLAVFASLLGIAALARPSDVRSIRMNGSYGISHLLQQTLRMSKDPLVAQTDETSALTSGNNSISCSVKHETTTCLLQRDLREPPTHISSRAFSRTLYEAMDLLATRDASSNSHINKKTFPAGGFEMVEFTDFNEAHVRCTKSKGIFFEFEYRCDFRVYERSEGEAALEIYRRALQTETHKALLAAILMQFASEGLELWSEIALAAELAWTLDGSFKITARYLYGQRMKGGPDGRTLSIEGQLDGALGVTRVTSVQIHDFHMIRAMGRS